MVLVLAILVGFSVEFLGKENYEFLIYIAMIVLLMWLMLFINSRQPLPQYLFWGFALWAFLHLGGGGMDYDGARLFDWIIFPLSDTYPILRYDQVVHLFAYAVITVILFYSLRSYFPNSKKGQRVFSLVLLSMGLGIGAFYEILEFLTTIVVPENGVGGYINNALDLVFDFFGVMLATLFVRLFLMEKE